MSPGVTFRIGKHFLAMLWLCCAILVHVSAMDENVESMRREEEQSSNRLSSDVAEAAEEQSLLHRERRAVKNNTTPNHQDIEKRLQAIEQRLDALLRQQSRSRDSSLLSFLLGRDRRYNAKEVMGPPGPPGLTGPKGVSGKPGSKGDKGDSGRDGAKGPRGPKGEQGAIGRTGNTGAKGAKGKDGKNGKSGVKYVRWGRTTCPSGAQIVYKGLMGGEAYTHRGGGVNYLCLPHNPKYGKYQNGMGLSARMFGSQYEMSFNPFSTKNLHNLDAVCVVCFVKSRGSMLMMPARNDCPSGWTEEYHGYLMSEYYTHHRSEYICVDKDAEAVPGSQKDLTGILLYPVEGVCGTLPCGPYVGGREFTCAVCTK